MKIVKNSQMSQTLLKTSANSIEFLAKFKIDSNLKESRNLSKLSQVHKTYFIPVRYSFIFEYKLLFT